MATTEFFPAISAALLLVEVAVLHEAAVDAGAVESALIAGDSEALARRIGRGGDGANAAAGTSRPTAQQAHHGLHPVFCDTLRQSLALTLDCFRPGVCESEAGVGFSDRGPALPVASAWKSSIMARTGSPANVRVDMSGSSPRVERCGGRRAPVRVERRSHAISRWSLRRGSRQSRASRAARGAPQDKLNTVIAEDASFVPGRQIRDEVEAGGGQLAKQVSLVSKDGHDDLFNLRKRAEQSVEVPGKMWREYESSAIAHDREGSVWRGGIVVDHQVARDQSEVAPTRDSGGYSPGASLRPRGR